MNISGTSNSFASLSALQGLQPQQVGSSTDADAASTPRPHRMHGGGHMRQAVTQALQSLGLTPPSSLSAASGSASTDASGSDSSSATSSVQQDMQQFMHSLFEAVKSESGTSTTSTPSSPSDPKASFADGLSSLISQASSGSAPSDLQTAFSKLTTDLQAAGASTAGGSAGSPAASAATGVQATLQAFLTNLQQDLGYGSSNASAIGNLVTAQV